MKKSTLFNRVKLLALGILSLASITSYAQTTTFNYTGAMQTYVVPVGVTSLIISATGAQGADGSLATGGNGGMVTCTLAVIPGSTLNIFVGGAGSGITGGYNGGGSTVNESEIGGGGGGATDIRVGGTALTDRILVAGGGGGGGYGGAGIGGGLIGGNGPNAATSTPATGGTQVAGGNGGLYDNGSCAPGSLAPNGTLGNGGAGIEGINGCTPYSGGGGGGGYYGGGGMQVNGGAGGSSYTNAAATNVVHTQGSNAGNGQLTITNPVGATLNFDGADDQVNCGTAINSVLDPLNTITVQAWVYPTSNASLGVIIGNYNNGNAGMQFLLRRDNSTYTFWVDDGTGFHVAGTGNVVALNTWQHVTGVWDGSSLYIYLNGVLQSTTAGVTGSSLNGLLTNPVIIGHDNVNENFTGNIDEVRIWSRALCSSEIQNGMNCEIPTTGTGLLANYHFNEGIAASANPGVTTLTDASGNSYNGTLTNFALTGATSNWIMPGGVASGISCGAFSNPITGSISAQTNILCNGGSNGSLTVTPTGFAPFAYSWSPSGGTGATASGLSAGNYTCTITNQCGGLTTVTATITQPTALTATITTTTNPTTCSGTNGAIDISVSGGTSGYTFLWSNASTNQNATNLAAGTYSCTITDANSCTTTIGNTILTDPAPPTVTANSTAPAVCAGNSVTLTGGGAASYTWTGGVTDGVSFAPVNTLTYTVTGMDANGCTNTATTTVTVNPLPTITVTPSSTAICTGNSVTITASGALTYFWTPTSTTGSSVTDSPTSNTLYNAIGTDGNGCVNNASVLITVNPLPTVGFSVSPASTVCAGTPVTLSGTGATSYTWTGGVTNAIAFTPVNTLTYTVTGMDGNNCSNTMAATVTVNPLPTLTTSAADVNPCVTITNDALTGTPVGGTWSGPGVTGSNFDPATAGTGAQVLTYSFTDVNGCSNTMLLTVNVNVCTGVEATSLSNGVNVFPNPNNGSFTLSVNANVGDLKIEIVDMEGQVVYSSSESNVNAGFTKQISMGNMANGIYLLRLTANGEQQIEKISVQK